MKKYVCLFTLLVLYSLFISGCGPSEEEVATMTAAAWTPTPSPTPTAPPIPFNLTVLVSGEEDTPIIDAIVILAEIENGTQYTDDAGQAHWENLPNETVNLSINAQGYFPQEINESIIRGKNQLNVTLARDPYGLLSSEACAPSETMLYVEDFQDGHAQGWMDFEYGVRGWDLIPDPESPGNILISHTPPNYYTNPRLEDTFLENAVFRFQLFLTGHRTPGVSWHENSEPYDTEEGRVEFTNYHIVFTPKGFFVIRHTWPIMSIHLVNASYKNIIGTWHDIEISTYEGTLEVWMDGIRLYSYDDPQPLRGGGLIFDFARIPDAPPADAIAYFDNFSICELNAPFTPMRTPEPEP